MCVAIDSETKTRTYENELRGNRTARKWERRPMEGKKTTKGGVEGARRAHMTPREIRKIQEESEASKRMKRDHVAC